MRSALVWLFLGMLLTPLGSGQGPVDPMCEAEAAPCGYINPIIDLDLPDKPDCGTGLVLGAPATPEACMTPPTADRPVVLDGTLEWYWDVTAEGTYPNDPLQPIEIEFLGASRSPSWIAFAVEPSSFTLNTEDLFDPQNLVLDDSHGTQRVLFRYEAPITVTFTRTGEPRADEAEALRNGDGQAPFYIRMHSTASGDRFRDAYGVETFRFHVANDPDLAPLLQRSPAVPSGLFLLGLIGLFILVRRRG